MTREGYIARKRPAYRCMRGVSACPKIQTFCRKRPVFFDSHTPVGRAKAGTRFDSAICSPKRTTTRRVVVLFGGGEGSRTPVRKHFNRTFSERSQVSAFPPRADTGQTARFSRVMMRGRGNSYPPHGRHLNDAFPGRWPLRFRRSLRYAATATVFVLSVNFNLPVVWWSGATARLSGLHTPVETSTPPYSPP